MAVIYFSNEQCWAVWASVWCQTDKDQMQKNELTAFCCVSSGLLRDSCLCASFTESALWSNLSIFIRPKQTLFLQLCAVQEDSPCLGLVLVLLYLFKRRWRESMLRCCGFFRQAYIYQYDPNVAASENKLEKVYNRHSAEGSLSNTPLTCFPPFCMLCLKRRL